MLCCLPEPRPSLSAPEQHTTIAHNLFDRLSPRPCMTMALGLPSMSVALVWFGHADIGHPDVDDHEPTLNRELVDGAALHGLTPPRLQFVSASTIFLP